MPAGTGPARPGLKDRLRAGDQLVGALLRMPAEETVAMLGSAGFDFLILDCEHGPADVLALRQHLALAQLHDLAVVVRVGTGEDALTLRALDQGAEGILAPHIDTVQQAAELVRAAHYPPLGARGFATYTSIGGFGTVPADTHRATALDRTVVLAMLESPAAVGDARAICATEGIDGYLVGASDLGVSSGPEDLPVSEAVEVIHREAAAVGVWRAELVADAASARRALEEGVPLVVYNLTRVLMGVFAELRVTPATR